MTREQVMGLEGRKIDRAVAKALGWTPCPSGGGWMQSLAGDIEPLPPYSTDLNAVRQAEEAVIAHHPNSDMAYLTELETLTTAGKKRTMGDVLALARADATTRARAILLTLAGTEGE